MKTPLIILVGADKGGVGKTMVARALTEFIRSKGITPILVDTEALTVASDHIGPSTGLHRFYPDAIVADVAKVGEQMRVFDTLKNDSVVLIDIRAGLLTPVLQQMKDVGLLADAKYEKLRLFVFHVLGSSLASFSEVIPVWKFVDGARGKLIVVRNHINESTFFEWSDQHKIDPHGGVTIDVPHLAELACEHLDATAMPMDKFCNSADQSRILRGNVSYWLERVYNEFSRTGLVEELTLGPIGRVST